MPRLIMLVGESGSGKTTKANELLVEGQKADRNIVRVLQHFGKNCDS